MARWPPALALQEVALAACLPVLAQPRGRGLIVKPTGTGKSRVMRAIVYWLLTQRRRVVLCLPTEEILQQLAGDFRRECKTPFYIEQAERWAPDYSLITLASQQTIWRRLHRFYRRVVLLFDEAHHGKEEALRNLDTLRQFDQVLGFRASPWSPACAEVYGSRRLYHYPLSQAIADGYLCPYELWPFPQIVPRPQGFELYYCATNVEARELARSCPNSAYLGHVLTTARIR